MDGDPKGDCEASVRGEPAEAWLRTGYVPTLPGPGTWQTAIGLGLATNALLLAFSSTATVIGIAMISSAVCLAYAMRTRRTGQEALLLAAMAVVVLGWAIWLRSAAAADGPILRHAAVTAAAGVATLARYLALRRHALAAIGEAAARWPVGDLVAYAEFLLDRRPCAGAGEAARGLYRRASEQVLERPWPERRDVRVIERYASLLGERATSASDVAAARWWLDKARTLGRYAIGPDVAAIASGRALDGAEGAGKRPRFDDLPFHRGVPVWRVRVPHPDALLDGEAVFRAFLLPEGALLACLVQFESVVGRPVFLHRVFDVSDADVETYLAASEHHLRWRIEMYDAERHEAAEDVPSGDPDAIRTVDLRDSGIMAAFEQVLAHNAALGQHADIGSAFAFLTATFHDYAEAYGIEAAWSTLEAACARVPD